MESAQARDVDRRDRRGVPLAVSVISVALLAFGSMQIQQQAVARGPHKFRPTARSRLAVAVYAIARRHVAVRRAHR